MRVVICGAGIAGLALANRLAALGIEAVVLERAPGPRQQGFMIDFHGPGYDAVEAMDLLPRLKEFAYPIKGAIFVDEHGDYHTGVQPEQFAAGGRLLNVTRPDLEQVLREHVPAEVDLRFGANVVAVANHSAGVRVTLDDGAELEADLLVGADGIHSTVRRLAFGDESRFFRHLGFHTMAFSFDAPDINKEIDGWAPLTDTVDRQMGFYALRGDRVAAFGVHRTADPTLPDDVRAAVHDIYGGMGWVVPRALEACPASDEIYYDQVAQIELPSWSAGRVVLLGDACYAVSLLAGLGASLGISGAYVLADQLARSQSIEQALVRYEELWRPVAEDKQQVGRSAARWFLPASKMQLRVRRAALLLARVPLVDRYVATTLAGKSTAVIKELRENDAAGHTPHPRQRVGVSQAPRAGERS